MTLTLRAVSLNDAPLSQPITAHFDAQGGTIGRSNQNTLSLPDPERYISRQHAEICAVGRDYVIRNIGTSNPIMVRNRMLSQGETMALVHRDSVRIGGYLLEVLHHAPNTDVEAETVIRGRAGIDTPPPGASWLTPAGVPKTGPRGLHPEPQSAMDVGGIELSADNPFADLMGEPAAAPAPTLRAPTAPAQAAAPSPWSEPAPPPARGLFHDPVAYEPVPSSSRAMLPDDYDPFAPRRPLDAAGDPLPVGSTLAEQFEQASPFEGLLPAGRRSSIDELIGGGNALGGTGADASSADGFAGSTAADDPIANFLDERPRPAGRNAAVDLQPERVPELRAAFTPPRVRHAEPPPDEPWTPAPPRRPTATPASTSRAADTEHLRLDETMAVALPTPLPPTRSAPVQVPQPAAAMAAAQVRAVAVPKPPAMPLPRPESGVAGQAETPPAPVAAGSGASADAHALWEALCAGAGIRLDGEQLRNEQTMAQVGTLLRLAVEGTLRLMALRQSTRYEMHAAVTMIRPRENNPLKFSPDAQSALLALLQPPARGYLPGPTAMDDAMNDLLSHAMGTMAGTRAALEGVLGRFAPGELETQLDDKNLLARLLPMNRRSQLWELYLQHYERIREEAQEDFHTLFGKAFLAAYEQQLDRLYRERQARTS